MNSKFCAKLQKNLEESVANGDEVMKERKADAQLFLYCSGS